jgi:multiple sugar transport system ATP-binding protein
MRGELKEMQRSFNTTTIYVTHDFMEAMSLADRIAVLNKGKIEQLGTSIQMYYTPVNEFVARLFGEPEINIFPGQIVVNNGQTRIAALDQKTPLVPADDDALVLKGLSSPEIDLGIRGVDVSFSFASKNEEGWIQGSVFAFEPIGNKVIMTVDVAGEKIRVSAPNDATADLDQPVWISLNMKNAMYFRRPEGTFITRSGIEKYK